MTDRELVQNIMDTLGMSAANIAQILKVSESLMSLVKQNQRNIPLTSSLELSSMLAALNTLPPTLPPASASLEQLDDLMKEAGYKTAEMEILKKKLHIIQTKYNQGQKMLLFLDELEKSYPIANEKVQRWFDEQRYHAGQKIENNGWKAQLPLQLKITLLQAEIQFYDNLNNKPT